MKLDVATYEAAAVLNRMERKLIELGLPGPMCRMSMHSNVGTAVIYFGSPDRVLVARDKVILLDKNGILLSMAAAMASCACQRLFATRLRQYEVHPIPSKVPKPVLHGYGSARWNQYYIKLLNC